jgi:nucleotidyltransferase/DNA polymerase involved in DNA repair
MCRAVLPEMTIFAAGLRCFDVNDIDSERMLPRVMSASFSYNKFLAKLASDHREPNGQFVVTPTTGTAFVETPPIGKFHRVGPVTATR